MCFTIVIIFSNMPTKEITPKEIMSFLIDFKEFFVANFLTKQDATFFLTKEDAKDFLTKEDARNFATKDDLKEFATQFATKDDLKNFATKEDLKNFATKEDIKTLEENVTNIIFGLDAKIDMVEESLQERITSVESRLRLDINRLEGS